MSKTLCDLDDLPAAKLPAWLWDELRKPRHYCSKCLRCARHKKVLCKAKRLPIATTASGS